MHTESFLVFLLACSYAHSYWHWFVLSILFLGYFLLKKKGVDLKYLTFIYWQIGKAFELRLVDIVFLKDPKMNCIKRPGDSFGFTITDNTTLQRIEPLKEGNTDGVDSQAVEPMRKQFQEALENTYKSTIPFYLANKLPDLGSYFGPIAPWWASICPLTSCEVIYKFFCEKNWFRKDISKTAAIVGFLFILVFGPSMCLLIGNLFFVPGFEYVYSYRERNAPILGWTEFQKWSVSKQALYWVVTWLTKDSLFITCVFLFDLLVLCLIFKLIPYLLEFLITARIMEPRTK